MSSSKTIEGQIMKTWLFHLRGSLRVCNDIVLQNIREQDFTNPNEYIRVNLYRWDYMLENT